MHLVAPPPTRRRWLKTIALALAGAPLVKLARFLPRRRRHPEDLAPIPWIGHC